MGYRPHHVQLAVPPGAEDDCRAFYVGVLGMTEIGHRRFYAHDNVGNRLEFLEPA
ncbi:hypothetical protein [Microbispora catharanthi]|uniref:hypothetical protein n=1 Tax=Microbispora catharanthi TaxID=1712871 RepID=UPI00142EDF8E|nr:hypothetical protein [Microbispora catharanthi]